MRKTGKRSLPQVNGFNYAFLDIEKKCQKHLFEDVHHSFEVHSCGSKHNIDVVSFNAFIIVSSESMILFEMTDFGLNGRSSPKAFLKLLLLVCVYRFIKDFGYFNFCSSDFADASVA